jgi:hypothetical protein
MNTGGSSQEQCSKAQVLAETSEIGGRRVAFVRRLFAFRHSPLASGARKSRKRPTHPLVRSAVTKAAAGRVSLRQHLGGMHCSVPLIRAADGPCRGLWLGAGLTGLAFARRGLSGDAAAARRPHASVRARGVGCSCY